MNSEQLHLQFNQHLIELLPCLPLAIKQPRLVVALSGGLDSVVLLHLLVHFQKTHSHYTIIAHNVNHGLSVNADAWTQFCQVLCEQLGVVFLSSIVSIDKQSSESLEALAREARYESLKEKMRVDDMVLTGHHQDDQLETLLLAIKRGSGSTGLQGIRSSQPFSTGYLIRPLLLFSRQALLEYAEYHQLRWVEDESNQDVSFDRNFIRQKISPLLMERWPAIAKSASRTAQLCQEQHSLLTEFAEQDLANCSVNRLPYQTLSIGLLSQLSTARRHNLIRFWLKSNGLQYPSRRQLSLLWQEVALAQVDKQPSLHLCSHSIYRYQGELYIVANQPIALPSTPITWSGESILWLQVRGLGVDFSKVDPALAKQYKVTCCGRQHLDPTLVCTPEGRDKARSIKKLLHEYQVPPWLRNQIIFIFINKELVEALGVWRCQRNVGHGTALPQLDLSLIVA